MININACVKNNLIIFRFDGGVVIEKSYLYKDNQEICHYTILKRCKEALRDWMYVFHNEEWRQAGSIFGALFILRLVIDELLFTITLNALK